MGTKKEPDVLDAGQGEFPKSQCRASNLASPSFPEQSVSIYTVGTPSRQEGQAAQLHQEPPWEATAKGEVLELSNTISLCRLPFPTAFLRCVPALCFLPASPSLTIRIQQM